MSTETPDRWKPIDPKRKHADDCECPQCIPGDYSDDYYRKNTGREPKK